MSFVDEVLNGTYKKQSGKGEKITNFSNLNETKQTNSFVNSVLDGSYRKQREEEKKREEEERKRQEEARKQEMQKNSEKTKEKANEIVDKINSTQDLTELQKMYSNLSLSEQAELAKKAQETAKSSAGKLKEMKNNQPETPLYNKKTIEKEQGIDLKSETQVKLENTKKENIEKQKKALGTVADVGMNVAEGFAGVGENIADFLASGIAEISEKAGHKEYAERVRRNVANPDLNIFTNTLQRGEDALGEYSWSGDTMDQVFSGVGQTGAYAALNAVPGAGQALSTGAMFTSAAGGELSKLYGSEDYQKGNLRKGKIWAKALGSGLVETASERLLGYFGSSGGLDKKAANYLSNLAESSLGKIFARQGVNAMSEGVEEFLSYGGNYLLDTIIDYVDKKTGGVGEALREPWNWEELWKEAITAAGSAFLMGGMDTFITANSVNGNSVSDALNKTAQKMDLNAQLESLDNQNEKLQKRLGKNISQQEIGNIFNQLQQNEQQIANIQSQLEVLPTARKTETAPKATEVAPKASDIKTNTEVAPVANEENSYSNKLKQTATEEINNSRASQSEKKMMLDILNKMDTVTDADVRDIRQTIQSINESQQLETKGNYKNDQERRQKYMQYKNDTSTYDSTAVDEVLDAIPQNRNGRRTVKQWLQAADEIGKRIANLSNEEIEKIAYKSWFDIQPSKSITQYDRQAKQQVGFQKFTSDEWINTINKAVNEARTNNQVQETTSQELPVVDEKKAVSTEVPTNLVESAKQQGFKYKDMNLEQVQKALDNKGIKSRFDVAEFSNENEGAKWKLTRNDDGTVTREIILNPKANEETVIQEMAIHELTHDIIAKNTDTSIKLYKEVKQWLEKDTDYQEQLGNLKEIYGEDLAEEEAIAKTLQTKFGNQEEINRLVNYNPSMARRIYDWVVDKLNKITGGKIEKLYWEDVRNKFERAYSEEGNYSLDNKSRSSIQENKQGQKYIRVDTDQNIFDGVNEKDYNKIAKMYIEDYLLGKTKLSQNEEIEITNKSAKKYTNPGYNQANFTEKMKLTPELKNVLDIAQKTGEELANKPNAKFDRYKYYTFDFELSGQMFSGNINVGVNSKGENVFYEINKIHKKSNNQLGTSLDSKVATNNSITSFNKNVNTTKYSIQNSENNTRKIQGLENYDIEDLKAGFKGDIQQILEDNDIYDVDIIDLDLHGSRLRGTANNNSDLDVVVQYEGDIREDDLFDILNEKPLEIEGIKVDINPIQENIKDYMERSNKYDQEILSKNNAQVKYSISTDGKMQDDNGKNITLEGETGNNNKTLLAIHNLTEEKLKGILDLGGFPVPSIAITNPDINSHDQFGDISVIFNKNTINPANRANEVYDRDVWSPVIPEIHYDINGSNIKEYITNNLELDLKDSIISDARLRYLYPENLADMVNRYGEKRTLEILKDSKELQYLYNKSENPNYKPQMKSNNFSNYHTNETLQRFIDIFNNNHDMSLSDFFYHYINYKDMELSESERIELNNEIKEAIKPEIQEYYDRYNDSKDNKVPQESINKAIQEELDNEIDSYGKFYDFLMNASHLEKNGVYEVIDKESTLNNISSYIDQEKYNEWVDNTFGKLFKETSKGIRNNKELFTPSGNRRSFNQLYDEYNLKNLVKKLTEGKTKAGQKTFFEGGFGKTSANLATQFNSIEDIKNNQNKLKTSEEIQPIIQELTDKFNNDLHELVDYRKNNSSSYSNEFAVAMETFEDIQAAVEEFASKGKLTPDKFRKVLDSYYVFDTEKIPNNVINTIIDDLNEMRNIPTDYFEAKPQRAVGFDEIDAIVIPSDISNDVKQQLKDRGIKTIEYDRNNENERANIVKSLNEYKFSKSQLNFDQYLESRIAKKGTRTTLGELRSTYNTAPTADNVLATSEYTKKQALNPTEIANTNKESMNTTPQLETKNYKRGNKQSSFVSNILNDAQFLNKDLRQEMSKDENIRYYSGITNAETLEKAYNSLTEGGEKETLNWFSKDEKNTTAEDVAKGWILLKQYQDSGDYQGAVEVAKKMRQMGTSAGQAVQAYNIMARMSPEGMFYYAQSELNEAYNKMVEGKSKQWIEKNQDKFTLTPEETQTIIDTMKEVSEMEDGREKNVKLAQIQELVSSKIPPTAGQSVKAWMRISMLFNPKTQVRNVMGNTVVLPVNATADIFSGAMDKLISKKTGVRTTGVTREGIKGYGKGFRKGLFESYDDFRKGINTRNVEGNRFEIGEGKSFKNKGVGKALNRIDNILSFSLDAGDRGFYEASFTNSINNQLVLNKTNQVTQEMIDIATNEALQRTWQDNNAYTQAVLGVRRILNNINVKGYGLGDVLIPFAKTPANLTKAIVDYSPVGLAKTITMDAKKFNNSLNNGQYSVQLQHKFVQNLGKGMAGSLLYALGYGLAKAGFATGESDDDKDVKNFMKNSLGIGSYSIKIGNKSFTYDWAQPVATPLAIMTNYVKYSKDNPDAKAIEKAIKSLDIGSEQLLKQSFMESINTVLNGSGTTMENLSQAILDLPARAIPTLSKQVADMVDSTQRTSFEYGKPVQSAINSVVSKIPFASKSLPASVDTLGKEIQKYGGNNSLFNVMINPANTNKGQLSKAGEEIYNVYMETGDTTIFPRTAPYYINSKGEKINMTAQERSKFQTVTGKYVEDSLSTLIKDSEYKKLSNEEKAKVINQIVSDSYSKAKYDVLKIDSNEYEKLRNALKEIKPSTYYNYKFKTEGMKKDSEKIDVLINANYTNKEKTKIYETYIGSSDEKYQIMKNTDINITEYLKYKSQNFAADKEDDGTLQGKSISGSKKEKVLNYIQNMNITYTQKLMLFGMEYTLSDSEQKYIANYVSSLNISKEEKLNMLGKFKGFTVYKDGSYKY